MHLSPLKRYAVSLLAAPSMAVLLMLAGCSKSGDTSGGAPADNAPAPPANTQATTGGTSGQALYTTNCGRCHGDIGAARRGRAPDLSHIGGEHDSAWIADYARDPKSKDPGSRMPPQTQVSNDDLKKIGDYLGGLK